MSVQREQVEKALDEILKDQRLSHLRDGQPPQQADADLLDRLFSAPSIKSISALIGRISKPLVDLLQTVYSHLAKGEIGWYLITALVLILFGAVIWHAIRALRGSLIKSQASTGSPKSSFQSLKEPDFEKQAEDMEGSSQYQEAMRMLMRALMRAVQKRGMAADPEHFTLREVEAMIGPGVYERVSKPFRSCIDIFESRYYAGIPVTESDLSRFKEEYRQCREIFMS
jgi:hypothetical protein